MPIELRLAPAAREDPMAERLVALVDEHADNFIGIPGIDFGFMGLPSEYRETVIEERPGRFRRVHRVHETPVGEFDAITYHPEGLDNFHWEKRFVSTIEDLDRLIAAPRSLATWDPDTRQRDLERVGDRGYPRGTLWHPLGTLVRNATHEEVYAWFHTEPDRMHRYAETCTRQIVASMEAMDPLDGAPFCFVTFAHEMLITPWMGHDLFDRYVMPYDREIGQAIHDAGARWRVHCHGNSLTFLERFIELGVDNIEPLEPPPPGDVDLAEASRIADGRMMLSGNIASQYFTTADPDDVRRQVKEAIRVAAPGGGFTLRTTGGNASTGQARDETTKKRIYDNCEAYLLAGLEYGQYPIR